VPAAAQRSAELTRRRKRVSTGSCSTSESEAGERWGGGERERDAKATAALSGTKACAESSVQSVAASKWASTHPSVARICEVVATARLAANAHDAPTGQGFAVGLGFRFTVCISGPSHPPQVGVVRFHC
jgi:hypothetical protein